MIHGPGIAKRHEGCTFENFIAVADNRAALKACKALAEGKSGGVILIGPVGRGKTHLLAALTKAFEARLSPSKSATDSEPEAVEQLPSLRELIDQYADDANACSEPPMLDPHEMAREPRIEFWTMLDLVAELRREMKGDNLVISNRCRKCDLLILDDFGQERMTDFVLEELERIIDWRYRNMLPIAVSTNLSVDQLAMPDKYGERSISRWAESCDIVRVGGPDRRTMKGGKSATKEA